MRISDYKCRYLECGHIFEYVKEKDLEDWPETVECPECKNKARRVFSIGTFDVAQGKLGNAKNGYSTGSVSHCSEMGRFKGTQIKIKSKE